MKPEMVAVTRAAATSAMNAVVPNRAHLYTTVVLIPHRLPQALVPGELIERRKRFLTDVRLDDGRVIEAHLADRGRLEGIIVPGARVWVAPVEPGSTRKTAFTLLLAQADDVMVCVDPAGANRLVRLLLEARTINGLGAYEDIKAEVTVGKSRFDFALSRSRGARLLLEVKSVVAASGKAGLFPDAPSTRAVRHCDELAEHARTGDPAAIVLVAQRADVTHIRPHPVDPDFAVALAAARKAGVKVMGIGFDVGVEGLRYRGRLPVRGL